MEKRKGFIMRPILEGIEKEIERVFDEFFGAPLFEGKQYSFSPSLDIYEDEKSITIKVDVPGMTQKDISVEIQDNILTIKGERKEEEETNQKSAHIIERRYGKFVRRISLPENIEADKTKAKIKDGVLTITIPKKEEEKKKVLNISVEE
jgi:HSP20 family protein